MERKKQINFVFLIVVLMPFLVSMLPIGGLIQDELNNLLLSQAIFALPPILYLVVNKVNIVETLRIHKIKWSNVILLIVLGFVIQPVMSFISALSLLIGTNVISGTIMEVAEGHTFFVSLAAVAIIPAILEETVYRGVFYSEYAKISPKWAIFLSALLFGLLHENINQFSYAFAIGLVFALTIEATDSILSTMILHFIINASSVVGVYVYPKMLAVLEQIYGSDVVNAEEVMNQATSGTMDKVTVISTIYAYFVPAIICGILAFIVYRSIAKNAGRYEHVKGLFTTSDSQHGLRDMITYPLIIGMAICVVIMIYYLV